MLVLTRSRAKKTGIQPNPVDINERPLKKRKIQPVSKEPAKMQAKPSGLVSRNTELVPSRAIKRKQSSSSLQNENAKKHQLAAVANEIQVKSQDVEEGITMMRKIKQMLEKNFKNIAERLQLDPVPSCLFDLTTCHLKHHPKNAVTTSSSIYSLSYLDEDEFYQFMHRIRHRTCASSQFPGSDVLIKILESMLVRKKIF